MLEQSVERALVAHGGRAAQAQMEAGILPAALWEEITALGLPRALLPEAEGGAGCAALDVLPALLALARRAAATPAGEDMLARWALARSSMPQPEGIVTLGPDGDDLTWSADGTVSGALDGVPWGRHAAWAVVPGPRGEAGGDCVALVDLSGARVSCDANLAGEPRDRLHLAGAVVRLGRRGAGPGPRTIGAALRAASIAGAVRGALDLAVAHARVRQQFGKPIAAFQAIQQQLAVLAEEALAADMAVRAAFAALDGPHAVAWSAAAKSRCGDAARAAIAVAHQVLGAMGFTREHDLHLLTTRLMSWNAEFGGGPAWADRLCAEAMAGEGLWENLVAWGDAARPGEGDTGESDTGGSETGAARTAEN